MLHITDSKLESTLAKVGFNLFKFISREQMEELREAYTVSVKSSLSHSNLLYSPHNSIAIQSICRKSLNEKIAGHSFFSACFIIQQPSSATELYLHQDWNIVDESKGNSLQIYVPLDISYRENGGLFFLPYSHRFLNTIRSGSFGNNLVKANEYLKSKIVALDTLPGDALAYYNSTFHGAFPNQTTKSEVALLISLIPEKSNTFYFHKFPAGDVYSTIPISSETLMTNLTVLANGEMPSGFNSENLDLVQVDTKIVVDENDLEGSHKSLVPKSEIDSTPKFYLDSIIRNNSIAKPIKDVGYKVIPFLTPDKIDRITELFKKHLPENESIQGSVNTTQHSKAATKKEIHGLLTELLKTELDTFFSDYKVPIAVLYSKTPSENNDVDVHFEPTLIFNENTNPTISVWITLNDVDETNGAIQLIPKSHLWPFHFVSHQTYNLLTANVRKAMRERLVTIRMKAGEAIIWDQRLIHSSTINKTDKNRNAIIFRLIPRNAQIILLVSDSDENNAYEVYLQPDDWFQSEDFSGYKTHPLKQTAIGNIKNFLFKYKLP